MSLLAPARPVLRGRQEPRLLTLPSSAVGTLADDAFALWDLTGRSLDPWQTTSIEAIFAVDALGLWACSEFGELVSRQQGKGEILQVWDLSHLYLWPKPDGDPKVILQTFHEFPTADAHYRKIKRRIMGTPWLRRQLKGGGKEDSRGISGISTGMGKRIFELENGSLLILQTRTGNAGVGLTVDALGVDEAQQSPAETMEALLFTQDGVPNTQVLYTGTVPTATQDGAHFESVRDRGRAGGFPRTGWAEFTPDGSDDPDTAAAIRPDDREVWAQSSPALGVRTSEADIEDKYNALKDTNLAAFLAQRLSIWPNRRKESERSVNDLDMRAWNDSAQDQRLGAGAVLAVSLGRGGGYSSICGAWRAPDGTILVEHLATDERTLWVPSKLKELRARYASPLIVLDERNCAPIVSDLARAGLKFTDMNTTQVGAAFELFVESVNTHGVTHPGQSELTTSLKYATPRAMGRGGLSTWEQSNPQEPVTLAQAVTLALWGVKQRESRQQSHTPILPAILGGDDESVTDDQYTISSPVRGFSFLP